MRASQPCDLCGCSEVNLHDGFYFCTECGTQDKNFQETIVETVDAVAGDGIIYGTRKKLKKVVEETNQMSDAWYRWHAFNFLLKGTADELLEYGANPSFKTKLLWVWVRYMKKHLKQEEMGLNKNSYMEDPEPEDNNEDIDSDVDEPPEDMLSKWDLRRDRLIKSFSFSLLVALIFVALNLDNSVITLTHLLKLFRDGLLSVPYKIEKIIPKELKPDKLFKSIRKGVAKFKSPFIRMLAMTLFKRLDLGNPIVPDLRFILDNHFKELCLPNDLKPLVLSLMHYKPCNFLDVNAKDKIIYKVPSYEFHIMTYIIWALKLCLGLDCKYEVKLSKAAEAVNDAEDRPKSFNINGESPPTNRLFSFREWYTYYQFKKTLVRHYCHRFANRCSWDTDDYIALDHHMDLLETEYKKVLTDEMAHEFLTKLKGGEEKSFVIPISEFKPTLTPFHSYTQVLVQHLQDPEIKEKLMEDFTQYSLKYAFEDWNLINPNSRKQKNLVKGVRVGNKEITGKYYRYNFKKEYDDRMVYVKNCENHNWLTTKPPTLDHVVKVNQLLSSNVEENQSDFEEPIDNPDSKTNEQRTLDEDDAKSRSISEISLTNSSILNSIKLMEGTNILESKKLDENEKCKLRKWNDSIASNTKFPDTVSEYSFANSTLSDSIRFLDETKVFESSKLCETEKDKLRKIHDTMMKPNEIKEETEGENIFDDDFEPEIKKELEEPCVMDYEDGSNVYDDIQDVSFRNNETRNKDDGNDSDVSSIDSVVFDEAAFDRAKVIKEIILYTCKKHKLPTPPEYKCKALKKYFFPKQMGTFSQNLRRLRIIKNYGKDAKHRLESRNKLKSYVTGYQAAVDDDILNQIANKVNMAVQNANSAQEVNAEKVNEAPPLDAVTTEDANADISMDIDSIQCTNDKNCDQVSETLSKMRDESDEDRFFSEDSEGETYAKDLLPKKNPKFDEEMYDPSQLYLKAAKVTDPGEMELDPKLSSIITKKINKDSKDPSLLTWTEERKKIPRPDSEDDMPLSVLQELKKLSKKLSEQDNEPLERFLDETVENIRYWFKFYIYAGKHPECRVFEDEVMNGLPRSFSFLLRECAHSLNVSEGDLYKNLQNFEITSIEKCGIKLDSQFQKAERKFTKRFQF